jgi:superfamily II DNA or RNA helicase
MSKNSEMLGIIYVYIKKYYPGSITAKIGSTCHFVERMSVYKTAERDFNDTTHEIWKFEIIKSNYNCYELDDIIKKLSKVRSIPYKHYDSDGGNEHYHFDTIEKLKTFFSDCDIVTKCEKINIAELKEEMKKLDFKATKKNCDEEDEKILNKSIQIEKFLEYYDTKFRPRDDQQLIINETCEYFEKNDKGILQLMCGIGKTLISLWICEKMGVKKIIIGVPNLLLIDQWCIEITKILPILQVKNRITMNNIFGFLQNYDTYVIITTYASCNKVLIATKKIANFSFDMKINDECHHLTTKTMPKEGITKTYIEMINIEAIKQLSLTATIKYLKNENIDRNVVSNGSEEHFGKIITRKNFSWAIEKNILCDYELQIVVPNNSNNTEYFDIKNEHDQRLFFSAYSALQSINSHNTHHLLIYSNCMESSFRILHFINLLLDKRYFSILDFYSSVYHGDMKKVDQENTIRNFEGSKFGIICCVYCLGEGWDFPLLDGVVIAENMSMNIRIIQSSLRASRKNKEDPNKKTKIILPVLSLLDSNDSRKVRDIAYHIGLEDDKILDKVKVYKLHIEQHETRLGNFGVCDEIMKKRIVI